MPRWKVRCAGPAPKPPAAPAPMAARAHRCHGGSRSPLSPALPAADGTHRTPEDMAEQILDYLEAHGYLHDPRLRSVLNGNGNGNGNGSLKHAARAG